MQAMLGWGEGGRIGGIRSGRLSGVGSGRLGRVLSGRIGRVLSGRMGRGRGGYRDTGVANFGVIRGAGPGAINLAVEIRIASASGKEAAIADGARAI